MGVFDSLFSGSMQNASTVTKVGSGALTFVIMLITGVLVAVMVGGIAWFIIKWRQYNEYDCIIYERDGFGQLKQTTDRAGVFVDNKTKNKRLYLKKGQVGLDPDAIPYVSTSKGNKVVYLLRTGLKNYHFINLHIEDTKVEISVGEEDVNWAINSYERQKKLFSQSLLMQIMPFIALAFTGIIILIIFIYFFKEFGTLADVAQAMKEASIELARGKGTTVIAGA